MVTIFKSHQNERGGMKAADGKIWGENYHLGGLDYDMKLRWMLVINHSQPCNDLFGRNASGMWFDCYMVEDEWECHSFPVIS